MGPAAGGAMQIRTTRTADLRTLFDRITVQQISVELLSFDVEAAADSVASQLNNHGFDVAGVTEADSTIGYVKRNDLLDAEEGGQLRPHIAYFESSTLLDTASPMSLALEKLRTSPRVFVHDRDRVSEIVTRADLQKTPVRIWLFGIVSLFEMQLLRLIHLRCPHDGWRSSIEGKRVRAAERLFKRLKQSNEELELADCLQLQDKGQIILDVPELRAGLANVFGGVDPEEVLKMIAEEIRHVVAHSRPIVESEWPYILEHVGYAEVATKWCEGLSA